MSYVFGKIEQQQIHKEKIKKDYDKDDIIHVYLYVNQENIS